MANPISRPLRVFLCHSSNDKPTVRELYNKLNSEGWIDAWLDEKKIYPGQDWNYEIEQAVEKADVILVCFSKNSVTKEGYIQKELTRILNLAEEKPEGTIYIIPIRLEECEPPKRIKHWQYEDYFPESHRNTAYQRLLVSLKFRAIHLGVLASLIQKKEEFYIRSSVPARSASVFGATTSKTPAAFSASVTVLQGVGNTRAASFAELGLYTLADMLYYYPQSYESFQENIVPIYSIINGIPQKWFRNSMESVVTYWAPTVVDTLSESIRLSAGLISMSEALLQIHFPVSREKLRRALERLKFDEIFYLQMLLLSQKREWKSVYTERFSNIDENLMEKALGEAHKLFSKDPELSLPEHSLLAEVLKKF